MADPKKYLSKIVKGSDTLWLKDSEARTLIADIQSSITGSMHFLGTSTTALSDGLEMVDSNPGTGQIVEVTIAGVKYRKAAPGSGDDWKQLKSGDVAVYASGGKDMEFVYNDVTHKWQEYGSTGSLKALAFKDNASATYTPQGSNAASAVSFTGQTTGSFVTGFDVSPVLPSLGNASDGDFVTGFDTAPVAPSFTEGSFTPASLGTGFYSAGTAPSLGEATTGNFNTDAEKSSYDENSETLTLSAATTAAAVTAQGTFSAGTVTTLDLTKFSGGSKAADTWSAGTVPTLATGKALTAQGTFSAGTAPTLATGTAVTAVGTGEAAAQTFTGTAATITVS